jgi:hypothetical protein
LCVAIGSAAPVKVATFSIIIIGVGTLIPAVKVRGILRHWHPQLFTRPPPASGSDIGSGLV